MGWVDAMLLAVVLEPNAGKEWIGRQEDQQCSSGRQQTAMTGGGRWGRKFYTSEGGTEALSVCQRQGGQRRSWCCDCS